MDSRLLPAIAMIFIAILASTAYSALNAFQRGELSTLPAVMYGAVPLLFVIVFAVLTLIVIQARALVAKIRFNRCFVSAGRPAMPSDWVLEVVALYRNGDDRSERNTLIGEVAVSIAISIEADLRNEKRRSLGNDVCSRAFEIYKNHTHIDYARAKGLVPTGKPAIVEDAFRTLVFASAMSKYGTTPF